MIAPPPPPMAPTPPAQKRVAFWDIECYRNYWLLKFRFAGQKQALGFDIRNGQCLSYQQISQIQQLFAANTTVSFNGNHYDVWVLSAALSGASTDTLKVISDKIIVEQIAGWKLDLPRWEPADHIDLKEVCPGLGSLKLYAARIHSKSIRDLPYDPDIILTDEQIAELGIYCENDLDDLEDLWNELAPQVHLREMLSKRYGMDLRSKSDAQLAEAVLKQRCEQALGRKIYKPDIDWGLQFKFQMPQFISYQLPQLQHVKRLVEAATFGISRKPSKKRPGDETVSVDMPPELEGLSVGIGNGIYRMGIGGLHSSEKCVAHKAENGIVLRDRDVASYYPSLILNSGKWPAALGGAFAQQYSAIKADRLKAKREQARLSEMLANLEKELEDAKAEQKVP